MLELPADTQIRLILVNNWPWGEVLDEYDPVADGQIHQPEISTGWWDNSTTRSQVTVTNPNEGVLNGGETGYTASDGYGGVSRIWTGFVDVDVWVKEDDITERATQDTIDANRDSAKQVSYMLAKVASEIIGAFAGGYRDPETNEIVFRSLGVDQVTRRPVENDETLQRYGFQALFNHADRISRDGETTAQR